MSDCIFCKIANGDIETEIKHRDDDVIAFADINPQAPLHMLIVPKKHIKNVNEAEDGILGRCVCVAKELAAKMGIADDGYRVVINCNGHGGQEVDHLHIHLLGGRQMKWPPG